MTLAVSLALIGGGAGALAGGTLGYALLSAGLLGAIVLGIMAVSLGIERFPFEITLSLLLLPWLLFLYAVGQQVVARTQPDAGYFLLMLGGAVMARLAFARAKSAAPQQMAAHAH